MPVLQDTGKYVFGVADTLTCLDMGAVETLVVWEDLQVYRYELMNTVSGEELQLPTSLQITLASICHDPCCSHLIIRLVARQLLIMLEACLQV